MKKGKEQSLDATPWDSQGEGMADEASEPAGVSLGYEPLPSQKEFHQSLSRFKGFSGPVGSGKSRALCHEAVKLCTLNPGRLGVIGAPTYQMLRDTTQRALIETLDQMGLGYEWHKSENALTFLPTGSKIIFRAVEKFERLRGTNLAWFGIDELSYCPEDAWLRLEARLRDPKAKRLCGFAVWTPKGYDWLFRRFVEKKIDGYKVVFGKPFENHFVLDQIPDYYERLRNSYDEQLYRQEVLGEYLNFSAGKVYSAFAREVNLAERELNCWKPVMWACDFNVEPMCSVVAQEENGILYVLDEIVLHRSSTGEMCEEFHRRYQRFGPEVTVYGDASGNHRQTAGSTDYQIIQDSFRGKGYRSFTVRVPKANPPVRERIGEMNGRLRNAYGKTRLFVSPGCKELIRDFEELAYKPDSLAIDKDRDPQRSHLSDALGYLVWQVRQQRDNFGEQNYRLL